MFSKALFKQSCKANGTMWSIITVAVCFMLACVMLISGNGNIGEVKNSIQDTIITKEVDAGLEKRAVNYYNNAVDGLWQFDRLFAANATDTLSYLTWLSAMPKEEQFTDPAQYMAAMQAWQSAKPEPKTEAGKSFENAVTEWQGKKTGCYCVHLYRGLYGGNGRVGGGNPRQRGERGNHRLYHGGKRPAGIRLRQGACR